MAAHSDVERRGPYCRSRWLPGLDQRATASALPPDGRRRRQAYAAELAALGALALAGEPAPPRGLCERIVKPLDELFVFVESRLCRPPTTPPSAACATSPPAQDQRGPRSARAPRSR